VLPRRTVATVARIVEARENIATVDDRTATAAALRIAVADLTSVAVVAGTARPRSLLVAQAARAAAIASAAAISIVDTSLRKPRRTPSIDAVGRPLRAAHLAPSLRHRAELAVSFVEAPTRIVRRSKRAPEQVSKLRLLRANFQLLRANLRLLRANLRPLRANFQLLRANLRLLRANLRLLRANLRIMCRR